MHKFTKWMLVLGIVLTLISFIVMVVGYGFAFEQILEEDFMEIEEEDAVLITANPNTNP